LTDAELFISYNMPAKALGPLISALPKAPRDLRLNQKLVALHTRAGRFAEAGVCCRTLESIYHDAGHADEASRYGDLAAKYEERSAAGSTETDSAATSPANEQSTAVQEFEISVPVQESSEEAGEAAPVPAESATRPVAAPSGLFFHGATTSSQAVEAHSELSAAPAQEQAAEIDLSSEWEQDLSVEAPPTAEPVAAEGPSNSAEVVPAQSPKLDESIEEVRFYLGQGMTEQAEQALAKLEALSPGAPELAVLRFGIESAKQHSAPAEPEHEIPVIESAALEEASAPATPTPQPWPSERPVLQDIVSELESSLGNGFIGEAEPVRALEPATDNVSAHTHEDFRSGTLDDFVSDLEASLGTDFAPQVPVDSVQASAAARNHVPIARAAAAAAITNASTSTAHLGTPSHQQQVAPYAQPKYESAAGVDLSDLFGELKQQLEEGGASADEDPETHYNLGVAFREMGLLDEAIGELQKVCQCVEHGHAFSQIMQTYTWLAQCFLDKGVPEVAIRWYEKALKLPSLDQETRTALHYELGSSFESAGNNPAALSNFLEVYGSNIDYRDVAERIKALRT